MNRSYFAPALATALMLAGCSQFAGSVPPPETTVRVATAPPQFKNQHTRGKYASIRVKLKTKADSFCVPEFHGFGGTIEYAGVDRSVELALRSSTENIYDEPLLGSGAPIFYLNLHFLAGTQFGSKFKSQGGLTGATIQSGQPYTAFGVVAVGHLVLMFPPCYAVATQGAYGGVLPGLGALFSDTTITGAGYGVVEIYPGMQVSQEC
jgi:hypothetical protein